MNNDSQQSILHTDFYCGNTKNPISVSVTVAEVPKILINEEKYGLYLRNAIAVAEGNPDDEPVDGGITAITIRLTVDESLEPIWEVITSRGEPKSISARDRQLLSVGVVGFDYEKDFLWGRNSVLQKYANSKDALHDAYKTAMRSVVENVTLAELDQTSDTLMKTGNVPLDHQYTDIQFRLPAVWNAFLRRISKVIEVDDDGPLELLNWRDQFQK